MNCTELREHLSAYLDGELEQELAERVKAHLATCGDCRAEFESLEQVTGLVHALPREPAPGEIEHEVVSCIEEDILLKRPGRGRWKVIARNSLGGLGLVAAAVLVGLSIWVYMSPSEPQHLSKDDTEYLATREVAKRFKAAGTETKETGTLRDLHDRPTAARCKGADADLDTKPGEATVATRTGEGVSEKVKSTPGMKGERSEEVQVAVAKRAKPTLGADAKAIAATKARPVDPRDGYTLAGGGRAKADVPSATQPPAPPSTPMSELAQTEKKPAEPAEPEVLELVLAADNFEEARERVLAIASSLNIRTVDTSGARAFDIGGGRGVARRGVRAPAGAGRAGPKLAEAPKKESGDEDDRRLNKARKAHPVVVLVLAEDELPRLVANLAAPRLKRRAVPLQKGGGKLTRAGETEKKVASLTVEKERPTPAADGAKTPRRAEEAGKDLERSARELAEAVDVKAKTSPAPMESRQAKRGGTRKGLVGEAAAGKTAVPPGAAAAKSADKRDLLEDALKQKYAKDVRLVYIRIYFTPLPRTVPAAKPE